MGKARRARVALAAVGVAVGLAVAACGLAGCSSGGHAAPAPRARAYANVDACLLTGPGGVADPAAAPVWAGMADVSATGQVRTSYLAVPAPATAASVQSHLGSLLVSKCDLIIAVGDPERAAVLAQAPNFPSVHFLVLGPAARVSPNVETLDFAPSGIRAAVASAVRTLAG
jgi:hypothetical protein